MSATFLNRLTDMRHWRILVVHSEYNMGMPVVIIETSIFARQVQELLTAEEYRELQMALVSRPHLGTVIKGSGGLRKARWPSSGKGKRGGVRVIYYWAAAPEQLLMLFMYSKAEKDDLSPAQLRQLRKIIEEEYP